MARLDFNIEEGFNSLLREQGYFVTPPGGGWVTIHGNRGMCPQGMRIPRAARQAGVRHMDIFWAINEQAAWGLSLYQAYLFRAQDRGEDNLSDEDVDDFIDAYMDANGIGTNQLTWMEIVNPWNQQIRFYGGEVTAASDELIESLLQEGQVKAIRFDVGNPIWDEVTRDMVDSLMLDGLSYGAAQEELIKAGELEDRRVPSWYYTVIRDSWLWHNICEEPEYEAFYAKGEGNGNVS